MAPHGATPLRTARLARVCIPDVPYHVTERGNRRQPVFFGDEDRVRYLDLLAGACAREETRCLAWCLMTNHVHLHPGAGAGGWAAATLGEAHWGYTRAVNMREGWRG